MADLAAGPSAATAAPARALRSDSIRLVGTVGNAVAIQAPSAGAAILPALMAGLVGISGPLSFGLAIVAMLFVAYAFTIFTREFSSAGSVYAFNGTAMGSGYGFISVWLLLAVYIAYAGSTFCLAAAAAQLLVQAAIGVTVAWPIFAFAVWALAIALAYRSITVSSVVAFTVEAVALVLVAIVAAAVVAHGGYHEVSLSTTPFTPHGLGFTAIGLGVIFAFTGFSGFEVAATLGEESSQPKRVVPVAIVSALLISGGVYTALSWVETVAFPNAHALIGSGVPLVHVAKSYVSPGMGIVVNVAILASGLGAPLACVNGATRLLFALGRDGFGPRRLAMTHPVHRSPVGALAVVAVLSLVAFLPLLGGTPLTAFFDIATYGADLIIVVYLMTVIAALIWSVRTRRRLPVRLVILAAGAVVLGYVLKSTVYPVPEFPLNLLIYLAGATIVAGLAILACLPGLRRRLAQSPMFNVRSTRRPRPPAAPANSGGGTT